MLAVWYGTANIIIIIIGPTDDIIFILSFERFLNGKKLYWKFFSNFNTGDAVCVTSASLMLHNASSMQLKFGSRLHRGRSQSTHYAVLSIEEATVKQNVCVYKSQCI